MNPGFEKLHFALAVTGAIIVAILFALSLAQTVFHQNQFDVFWRYADVAIPIFAIGGLVGERVIIKRRRGGESPERISGKDEAARANEGLKLGATYLNGLAIAAATAALISPALSETRHWSIRTVLLGAIASLLLHLAAQAILRLWRTDDDRF